jgi:hypothetical protein
VHRRERCDSTVTLFIGPNRHNIYGEKALLACFSQYFEKLLYGCFRESSELCVELPEDDQRVVAAFVHWTSSGAIDAASKEIPKQESHFYKRLWIYGDKILAPNFCDFALEFLIQKYRSGKIRATDIEYVYENTTVGSKLRRFLVTACTFWSPCRVDFKAFSTKQERHDISILIANGGRFPLDLIKSQCKIMEREDSGFKIMFNKESFLACNVGLE